MTTPAALRSLFSQVRASNPAVDLGDIERAYSTAVRLYAGRTLVSGDSHIEHVPAVTTILAELGMNAATLCASLLHDTVEEAGYTLDELSHDFGDEVALLVDACNKVENVRYGESAKSETVRKMIIAMGQDIRALVIMLAERLQIARTFQRLSPEQHSARAARYSLEIFSPLADRLGMNAIRTELEDRCFAALEPKLYDEIVRLVAEAAPSREEFLDAVMNRAQDDLKAARIPATVTGLPRHYYSIYQKMIVRGHDFSDIYDLDGLRVLVQSNRDCYAALGVFHVRWNPLPGQFRDYIAMPKSNMYQALHTTVLGPGRKPVEIQIATENMHRTAEYGVAAHWKYKEGEEGDAEVRETADDTGNMVWVRQLLDWQREAGDPGQFLGSLRFEITSDEVYVFTPKGDVISLPRGSTPVDFAYAIHTEVGHRCIGARVNGRLVPLESVLVNGDVVEIFTSRAQDAGPSRDWLSFVKSRRARRMIKDYFSQKRRDESIETGKDILARQMRKAGLPLQRLLTLQHLTAVAGYFKLPDVSALYAAVGEKTVSAQAVINRLITVEGGEDIVADETTEDRVVTGRQRRLGTAARTEPGVHVIGTSDLLVKLAKCCTPVPGDAILGFVTKGSGVSVHRENCANAGSLTADPVRLVPVEWAPTAQSSFLVAIQVEALDRNRLLSDITQALSDQDVHILSAALNTTKDRICKAKFTFEAGDPQHLEHVLRAIGSVDSVYDVYRINR